MMTQKLGSRIIFIESIIGAVGFSLIELLSKCKVIKRERCRNL